MARPTRAAQLGIALGDEVIVRSLVRRDLPEWTGRVTRVTPAWVYVDGVCFRWARTSRHFQSDAMDCIVELALPLPAACGTAAGHMVYSC